MPDEVLVFEHRHDVEGSVRFVKKQALVHVSCRWPFDRDADEWIFIANDLTVDDYVDCLGKLGAEGVGRAVGVDHGFIEFTALGPGKTRLEISDHAPHAPTRLSVIVPEGSGSLSRRLRDALGRT